MPNVAFENTRFDPDPTPFRDLAKATAQAFGCTADLALDRQLARRVRLRVARVNHCSCCLILHSRAARDAGIEQATIWTRPKLARGATSVFEKSGAEGPS